MQTIGTWWLWIFFFVFVASIVLVDIILLHKSKKPISLKSALAWTIVWVISALLFNIFIGWYVTLTSGPEVGAQKALEFLTGYLIEEMLSVDNMFAFLLIFNYFCVPLMLQRRVLLFGVLGAVIMRLSMILLGTWLITKLHWILYLFGAFLLFTGIKMLFVSQDSDEIKDNFLLRWMQKHIRVTSHFEGENFFIKQNNLLYATPLFLTLVMIELTDLIFALDSIPAIFAVTNDPFIVFTSNIFAVLGLRALYFLLRDAAKRFYLLKYGVAIILAFIGGKMIMKPWFDMSIHLALGIVVTILFTTILLSVIGNRRRHKGNYDK